MAIFARGMLVQNYTIVYFENELPSETRTRFLRWSRAIGAIL